MFLLIFSILKAKITTKIVLIRLETPQTSVSFLVIKILPDKREATAAIRKERTTAGPAWSLATWPVMTYTPAPNVLPTPAIKHVLYCH